LIDYQGRGAMRNRWIVIPVAAALVAALGAGVAGAVEPA
jgi:hypothetical protein